MAKYVRYMGEFLSRKNVVWRVEILQDAENAYASVGELTFEADNALVIEWPENRKEDVICGSTATIQIESPGDRTYEDLYTIEPGRIRMDVYRNNSLYWSGALDPEFYEEPYEKARNYVVSLTFSDFGILDRLKFNMSGMVTFYSILENALVRSCVNYGSIDADTYCSTYFEDGTKAGLSEISIRSENFFDEENEPCTMKEVVEGILQPLALRLVQRSGKVYVYDLNGLYSEGPSRLLVWDGDRQTLGTDVVANNVRINFSPYSVSELLEDELEYGGKYSVEKTNLTSTSKDDEYGEYYSYYPDVSNEHRIGSNWDYNLVNFTIFISSQGSGLSYLNSSARYFHLLPVGGGPSECTGIAWSFYTGGHGDLSSGFPQRKLNVVGKAASTVLMKSKRVYIPTLSEDDKGKYYLRLSMEMMLDPRYNPFSDGKDGNEKRNYGYFKKYAGYAFVPFALNIYDEDGNALCHYVNDPIAKSASVGHLGWAKGTWETGVGGFGTAWLEYYDPDDLKEGNGVLGWKSNRHCIGRPDNEERRSSYCSDYRMPSIFDSFKQMPEGEYVPYPPQGGYLEITIYIGVQGFKYDDFGWDATYFWTGIDLYDKVRWLLYKAPKIEVVNNNLVFDKAELNDVEYSGYINRSAKEEVSIDTICGTCESKSSAARGIIYRNSDNSQIQKLARNGVTDHPEKLLIGTLYSQYADRKVKLSGEAVLEPGGLCVFTERNQSGRKFMMKGEVQDVIMDTSEVVIVEFNQDNYEGVEE